MGASLNPKNAVAGGGPWDGECKIIGCQAVLFDYGGKSKQVPALWVKYEYPNGEVAEQNYSAGDIDKIVPSKDGKSFVHPTGGDAHFGKSSNMMLWVQSQLEAGFPEDKLGDDVTVFEGERIMLVNRAQPKRPGLKDAERNEGKIIAVVEKILALPGARPTAGAAKAAPSSAPSTASATSTSVNGDINTKAIETVQAILAAATDNATTRLKLTTAVMLTLGKVKDPDMPAVKRLAGDAAWLAANAEAGQWTVEGDTVKLAV